MKKKIKGIIGPLVVAIFVGYIGGRYAYRVYFDNLHDTLRSSRLYLVENGEYDSASKMREENSGHNYVYYKENDKYKSVIGITKDYDNVKKIEKLYGDNVLVTEYYVENDMIDSKQELYEKELMEAEEYEAIKEAVDNILNLYHSDDSIRLIAID